MLRAIGQALLIWISTLELVAQLRGWRGLSWLGRGAWLLAPVGLRAAVDLARRPGHALASLGLAALPALAVQAGASSLRGAALNPQLTLRPGRYPDRSVTRLDIPLSAGWMPALYITPAGGAAAAVCKLHGSGDDKTVYSWPMVDRLIAAGFAVLLVDLDGHGESPRPQSFPEILENAAAAVGFLRERHPWVGLIGVSLGGCIAARAVADGVVVDAVAVIEAPPKLRYTRADVAREAIELRRLHVLDLLRTGTIFHLIGALRTAPIRAAISTWDLFDALDLLGSLPRIAVPLLAIYGATDSIVKPAQAEQARRALPAGASFHMISGGSHLSLTLKPETLELLVGWLRMRLEETEERRA